MNLESVYNIVKNFVSLKMPTNHWSREEKHHKHLHAEKTD